MTFLYTYNGYKLTVRESQQPPVAVFDPRFPRAPALYASLQAAAGRHLEPAVSPYVWRALVWKERFGEWFLDMVFDMTSFEEAERHALEEVTDPTWCDDITAMHYIIGRVE